MGHTRSKIQLPKIYKPSLDVNINDFRIGELTKHLGTVLFSTIMGQFNRFWPHPLPAKPQVGETRAEYLARNEGLNKIYLGWVLDNLVHWYNKEKLIIPYTKDNFPPFHMALASARRFAWHAEPARDWPYPLGCIYLISALNGGAFPVKEIKGDTNPFVTHTARASGVQAGYTIQTFNLESATARFADAIVFQPEDFVSVASTLLFFSGACPKDNADFVDGSLASDLFGNFSLTKQLLPDTWKRNVKGPIQYGVGPFDGWPDPRLLISDNPAVPSVPQAILRNTPTAKDRIIWKELATLKVLPIEYYPICFNYLHRNWKRILIYLGLVGDFVFEDEGAYNIPQIWKSTAILHAMQIIVRLHVQNIFLAYKQPFMEDETSTLKMEELSGFLVDHPLLLNDQAPIVTVLESSPIAWIIKRMQTTGNVLLNEEERKSLPHLLDVFTVRLNKNVEYSTNLAIHPFLDHFGVNVWSNSKDIHIMTQYILGNLYGAVKHIREINPKLLPPPDPAWKGLDNPLAPKELWGERDIIEIFEFWKKDNDDIGKADGIVLGLGQLFHNLAGKKYQTHLEFIRQNPIPPHTWKGLVPAFKAFFDKLFKNPSQQDLVYLMQFDAYLKWVHENILAKARETEESPYIPPGGQLRGEDGHLLVFQNVLVLNVMPDYGCLSTEKTKTPTIIKLLAPLYYGAFGDDFYKFVREMVNEVIALLIKGLQAIGTVLKSALSNLWPLAVGGAIVIGGVYGLKQLGGKVSP